MRKRSLLKKLAITGMFMLGLITAAQANPINLALTGTATQSSTYPWNISLGARNAIDGNTDGNIYNGSVTPYREPKFGGNQYQTRDGGR